jgi:hypothetical protein
MVTLIVKRGGKPDHKTEWPNPTAALKALGHDCEVDGGFGKMYEASCYEEIEGKQVRQFYLTID